MFAIVLNGDVMERYDDPKEAYDAAIFAYEETGEFHEVRKLITE